jgi:hypothetical protein
MATLLAVAVVHLLVRLEILSPQVKSGPPPGSHLWLRPKGCAMKVSLDGKLKGSGRRWGIIF